MSYQSIAVCDTCGREIARGRMIPEAREAALRVGAKVWTRGPRVQHSCGPCDRVRQGKIERLEAR